MEEQCRLVQENYGDESLSEEQQIHAHSCPVSSFILRQHLMQNRLSPEDPQFSPDFSLNVMSLIVEEQSRKPVTGWLRKSFQHRMSVPMPLGVSVTSLLLASLMLNVLLWLPTLIRSYTRISRKSILSPMFLPVFISSTGDSPWSDVFITSWWDWYWHFC